MRFIRTVSREVVAGALDTGGIQLAVVARVEKLLTSVALVDVFGFVGFDSDFVVEEISDLVNSFEVLGRLDADKIKGKEFPGLIFAKLGGAMNDESVVGDGLLA